LANPIDLAAFEILDPARLQFEWARGEQLLLEIPETPLAPFPKGSLWALLNPRPQELKTLPAGEEYIYAQFREIPVHKARAKGKPDGVLDYHTLMKRPLAEAPRLWTQLGQIQTTPKSILSFASRYGFLLHQGGLLAGDPAVVQCTHVRNAMRADRSHLGRAEPLSVWRWVIPVFGLFATLLAYARMNGLSELKRHIEFREGGVAFYSAEGVEDFKLRLKGAESIRASGIEPGDFASAAHYYISEKLKRIMKAHLRLSSTMVTEGGQSRLIVWPANLLGGLLLEVASSVELKSDWERCKDCGKWFEIRPPETRSSRAYCSTSCRVKSYRQRRREARKLFEQGVSVPEVARRLEIEEDTAKRWVSTVEDQQGDTK
jgi:hypothetical protein